MNANNLLNNLDLKETWIHNSTEITNSINNIKNILNNHNISTIFLTKSIVEIITILNRINFSKFVEIFKIIDNNFSGISFHYIIESKQQINWIEGQFFIERLKILQNNNLLDLIFSPIRIKIISTLINEDSALSFEYTPKEKILDFFAWLELTNHHLNPIITKEFKDYCLETYNLSSSDDNTYPIINIPNIESEKLLKNIQSLLILLKQQLDT